MWRRVIVCRQHETNRNPDQNQFQMDKVKRTRIYWKLDIKLLFIFVYNVFEMSSTAATIKIETNSAHTCVHLSRVRMDWREAEERADGGEGEGGGGGSERKINATKSTPMAARKRACRCSRVRWHYTQLTIIYLHTSSVTWVVNAVWLWVRRAALARPFDVKYYNTIYLFSIFCFFFFYKKKPQIQTEASKLNEKRWQ